MTVQDKVEWVNDLLETLKRLRVAYIPKEHVPFNKDFPMFLRWHREGKLPLDKLVTRRYRLEDINEACSALEAGEILGRAIIEY